MHAGTTRVLLMFKRIVTKEHAIGVNTCSCF